MTSLVTLASVLISLLFELFLLAMNPSDALADSGRTAGDLYMKGGKTIQAGTGLLVSPLFFRTHRRELDYSMTYVRGGYFFTEPTEKKLLPRGNLEGIMQMSGSVVTQGFGNYMVEFALLLRYNVVYPGWRIVPYAQMGAGVLYNDLYKDRTQDLIGQSIEFSPQASVGFRYLISKNWSLDAEGIFQHISCAGLDGEHRNVGTNAFGGLIGVTRFFGPSAK
ncbi:MAG: acyloxyacyl hydrolase [Desulfobacteraceae bacterium]|nr:MAG: acyloxyacyl hydrolase [Desulfobacteraceae bacterium]